MQHTGILDNFIKLGVNLGLPVDLVLKGLKLVKKCLIVVVTIYKLQTINALMLL